VGKNTDIKITQVTYGRTINVGDYETVRIDLSADVSEGQTYQEVLDALKLAMDKEESLTRKEYAKN